MYDQYLTYEGKLKVVSGRSGLERQGLALACAW